MLDEFIAYGKDKKKVDIKRGVDVLILTQILFTCI